MAQGIIIFDNMTNFETWVKDVNDTLGYPDKHTETYTRATEHRNKKDDNRTVMCFVDDACPSEFIKEKLLFSESASTVLDFLPKDNRPNWVAVDDPGTIMP